MIRLVLFDIDGTLLRTGGAGVRAFAQVFEEVFKATDHFEKLRFAGRTDYSLVREFFSYHNVARTPENFALFFSEYASRLEANLNQKEITVCPGVRQFIEHAHALVQKPVIGLLTGNVRIGAELKLRRVGLWESFETGGFADDHEDRNKIAEIAWKRGAELVGRQVRGDEVLVIGDTPLDIRCARSIGARVLAVGTGGATMEELKEHQPDYLAHDLSNFKDSWLNGA